MIVEEQRNFVLRNKPITVQSLQQIPPTITSIEINRCQSSEWEQIGRHLFDGIALPNLQELSVIGCDCNGFLNAITQQSKLKILRLTHNPNLFSDANIQPLLLLRGLTYIDLDGHPNLLPEQRTQELLRHLPKLEYVKFDANCQYTNKLKLREIVPNPIDLKSVTLIGKCFSELTYLDIYDNQVGVEGAVAIGKYLPRLTFLNIFGNAIQTQGLVRITRYLPRLTNLYTSSNGIENQGATEISKNLLNLANLYMRLNHIEEYGALQIVIKLRLLVEFWVEVPKAFEKRLRSEITPATYMNLG